MRWRRGDACEALLGATAPVSALTGDPDSWFQNPRGVFCGLDPNGGFGFPPPPAPPAG